ncbi:MAG: cobalamin biosynthesis protein [Lachnospiraceae bacterium]|nr:cobalamin biosynthesis protein [Lachnospiraceae bacterium]
MQVRIISFTDRGQQLAELLADRLCGTATRCGRDCSLSEWVRDAFDSADALIYVGAVGICVRTIAPYIKSKTRDPAVVVIDETGRYVIPVLSGHLGGANDLARRIARLTGAEPVITTATDLAHAFSVDAWARIQGCVVENPGRIKYVSSKILSGDDIVIVSDFPISGEVPEHVIVRVFRDAESRNACIRGRNCCPVMYGSIDERDERSACEAEDADAALTICHRDTVNVQILRIVPRIVCAGVGCRRGIPARNIENAIRTAFEEACISENALCGVFSIDIKANEEGLREFCESRRLPFVTFSAEDLMSVTGTFTQSAFVKEITGVDNVCERSAVLGAGSDCEDSLIFRKHVYDGVTVALAVRSFAPDFRWTE